MMTLCFLSIVRVVNRSFQSYLKPERRCASPQLSVLTAVALGATTEKRRRYPSCQLHELAAVTLKAT